MSTDHCSDGMSLEDKVQFLYESFRPCSKEELEDYLRACGGDADLAFDNLLSSGYKTQDESSNFSGLDLEEPPQPCSSTSLTLKGPSEADGLGSSTLLKTQTVSKETDSDDSGAAIQEPLFSSLESTQDNNNNNFAKSADSEDDVIELELPSDFVHALCELYGHPGGKSSYSVAERTIKLDSESAFQLFRHVSLSVSKRRAQLVEKDQFMMFRDEAEEFQEDVLRLAELEDSIKQLYLSDQNELLENFKDIVERDSMLNTARQDVMTKLKSKKLNMAQHIKLAQLKNHFPNLTENVIEETFIKYEYNADKTLNHLKRIYPRKYNREISPSPARVSTVSSQSESSGLEYVDKYKYDPERVTFMSESEKAQAMDLAQKCKDAYTQLKKDMIQTLRQANAQKQACGYYFREASHKKNEMSQCLKEYSFYTVIAMNAATRNPNKVDLHGLSVGSAMVILHEFFKNREEYFKTRLSGSATLILVVVTGRGNHSYNNVPKINPAVRSFLIRNHFSFSTGCGNGEFIITLSRQNLDKKRK